MTGARLMLVAIMSSAFIVAVGYGVHVSVLDRYDLDSFITPSLGEMRHVDPEKTIKARNIFQFYEKPVMKKKPAPVLEARDVSTSPAEIEKKETITGVKYIGHIVKSGNLSAFILNQNERHVVGVGDFISPRLRIIDISPEMVKLQQEPTNTIHILYLSGEGG